VVERLDPTAPGIINALLSKEGGAKPDVEGLQGEFDRLNVPARVYQGDPYWPVTSTTSRIVSVDDGGLEPPGCLVLESFSVSELANGGQVAHIDPGKIPAGHHLRIVFPVLAEGAPYTGDFMIGLEEDPGPDGVHMPAPGSRLEDYVVDENGQLRWRPDAQQ
jgi:hypothetical protein